MKVVKLKCPECNAILEVNSDGDNIICNYCGAKVTVVDENESKTERVIRRLGTELNKFRNHYSSEEYKERLRIKDEEDKKGLKMAAVIFGVMILILIFMGTINTFFPTTKLYMTCTLDDKQYLVVIEKEKKVSCASCEETMLQEINEKYLVEDDIYLTEMNIESYFVNNSGVCE